MEPAPLARLKIQANGHTSFYKDSALRELNANSVQLTIRGTLAFTERISLDLGVTEDLIVQTSPDVVFHLALRGRVLGRVNLIPIQLFPFSLPWRFAGGDP